MKTHHLKIEKVEVIKSKSAYSGLTSFVAYYMFTTGQVAIVPLTDSREEYALLPSITPTHNDEYKARAIAVEQYNKLEALVAEGKIAHARATFKDPIFNTYNCNIYCIDETSPTGVQSAMGCAMKLADSFGLCVLSPTEGRRVAAC